MNYKLSMVDAHTIVSKYRSVPFVSDTSTVLHEYMSYRDSISDDRSPDSAFLMISDRMSDHSGKLPGKTYVDQTVKCLCSRAIERSVSNHTLRRTCARMWYRAGVPLATISSLLGHSDVKTTIKYLGLTLDDLLNGASLYDAYFDGISIPETAVPSDEAKKRLSSNRSGLGEISSHHSCLDSFDFCLQNGHFGVFSYAINSVFSDVVDHCSGQSAALILEV